MAQDPKNRTTVRPPARADAIATVLQTKLEDEAHVLESLVASLGRGQGLPEVWALLHEAAARDDRIPDLAFAYERLIQDRKLRFLSGVMQCEILMHAATFFADVFGDLDGATGYLEQVLAMSPSHPEAFAKIEAVLTASANGLKLADVYASAAQYRQDKDEQLGLLRRAAELADGFSQEHERAIKIYQSLLRIDPSDRRARRSLEERLRQAGKFREVTRLLEPALAAPDTTPQEARGIRERLIALYVGEIGEPERALPHVEEILSDDPSHEFARRTAHRLVSHKPLATRAAAALADAYERLGTYPEAAAMLEISLETLRGPKRAEGQKRLGMLKQDKLGDLSGAYPLLEAVIALDPGDDEVRRRYGELAKQLGKQLDAARLLSRAATGVKELGLKARLGTEVGELYLTAKDPKRARSAFAGVVEAGGDDPAILRAARALAQLYDEAKEQKPLAQMLELLARQEPEEGARCAAAERLGQLAENDLGDKPRAILAWRSLLGSPLHDEALAALDRLYTSTESYPELIDVLEKRVDRATNASAARALAQRAAELRTAHTKDRQRAISSWLDFLGIYGPSREVHAKVIPLLEQEKKWNRLAAILAEDLTLAPEAERIPILLKLAQVRLSRLDDKASAFEAYRTIWEINEAEPTARQALEKMLASPETRLEAGNLLEPVYRREGASAQLVRLLEARAESLPDEAARMAALEEAVAIAERDLRDPKRALELAGRALAAAARSDIDSIASKLEVVERIAALAGDVVRHAALLSEALGDRAIDSAVLSDLAKRTGEALASAGEPAHALAVYRRALAFEPSSRELLVRIDGLLAEEGRPEERIVLCRAALAEATTPERRRELYHAIATIERRDLDDVRAAIQTWRQALAENPADLVAYNALLDAYQADGDWQALYDELASALALSEGDQRAALLMTMGEVSANQGDTARALGHYRELLEEGRVSDELLSAMEALSVSANDGAELERVLVRRVALAADAQDECTWLERLGEVQADKLADQEKAGKSWKRAGTIAEEILVDEERARRLFERVMSVTPRDREANQHLYRLYVRADLWDKLPAVVKALVDEADDDAEAVRRLLEFEGHVSKSQGLATWISLADGLLARGVKSSDLGLARARVLSTDPARFAEAAHAFRDLITSSGADAGRVVDAFQVFLARAAEGECRDDRRFVLAFRAEHAPDAQRVSALLAWAGAEETAFGDADAAVKVYRRVLAIEPERAEALEASARLLMQTGDMEGAKDALVALRDSSEGASRRERDLEIADLLLSKLGNPEEALARVAPLIEAAPADAEALGVVYRALEHPAAREKAAALLERAATGAEDDQQALVILKTLLAMPRVVALDGARRRWFESLIDLHKGEPDVALETALAAVVEVPEDEVLWARAEKLARSLDQPGLVAGAYRRVLELPLPPELGSSLGRRAVDYQEEWFEDSPTVIALLERVAELAPEATWARDRLKLAFGSTERWDDLFNLYDDAIARAPDDLGRADLLAEAAEAAKDFASDADRAIGYFERLLALRPGDPRVTSLLERLYEKQGRIQPLIDLLSQELIPLTGEKAQRMRLRIAGLWLTKKHDDVAAFKLVGQVLEAEADRAEAFSLLEEMVFHPVSDAHGVNGTSVNGEANGESGSPPSFPPEFDAEAASPPILPGAPSGSALARNKRKKRAPSVRERAAALLKERYTAKSMSEDLARVLDVELSLSVSPKEQARRHQDLLTLMLETLHDDERAFTHAAALLALEPRTPAHRKTLGELAERLSAWERFAEVLVATTEASPDTPLVARLLIEAAEIYRDKVGSDPRAIGLFASVLELNIKDRALALSTARDLDVLLERAGQNEVRCGVLEKVAELETEPAARRAVLTELSRVASSMVGDPDRAIRAWRGYIDEGNSEIEAWDGLIAVLRDAQRWPSLIEGLERRLGLADPEGALRDLVEIAGIYERQLVAPEKAVDVWQRVRRRFGVGQESFLALAALLEPLSRWDDLARLVLEETGGLLEDPIRPGIELRLVEQKSKAALSIARTTDRALAAQVGQRVFDAGVAAWRAPLSDDTASEAAGLWAISTWWALDELVRMALEDRDYELAVQRMLDGSKMVFDRPRARQMRRQAAVVYSEHLGDPRAAVRVYRELLTDDSQDEIADRVIPDLSRLFGQLGAFGDLCDLWEQQAQRQTEASNLPLATELWARAADLAEKRLSDVDRAIVDYQKSAGAGSQNALRELARLFRGREEFQLAADALERLSHQASQEHLAEDTIALVEAYLAAGDRDRARLRLEQASEIAFEPRLIRARLRDFYREEQAFSKLAELLRIEAEGAEDKATRLELLREAAHIHIDRRSDPSSAIPLLEQARKLDVDDSSLGLTLTRALVAVSRFEDASGILRAELDRYGHRKPKERALVHLELARVSLRMGERARALAELDLAAKIDPAHPAILYLLGKLSAEEGQLDRAQRTFRALLLVLGRSEGDAPLEVSRGEVLFELSVIAQKENDFDRAEELIESALHASSENEREAERFEGALREKGNYQLLVRSLEARFSSSPRVETRAVILGHLAYAYGEHLGWSAEVGERLRAQADQTLGELEAAAAATPAPWAAIESVYERVGDAQRQTEVLQKRIALAEGQPASAETADPLYRLANLQLLQAETHAAGVSSLERALALHAEPDRAISGLTRALQIDPKNEAIIRLYEQVSRGPGREAVRADALVRLAFLGVASADELREAVALALQASDLTLAASVLTRMLEKEPKLDAPHAIWARVALANLLQQRGEAKRAADLKEEAAEVATGDERRALLLDVARAAMGPLGEPERAARIYATLREREPADREIWEPLLEIYRKLESTESLIALIAETLPLIESASERSRLRLEQATVLLRSPETEAEASRLLSEVLEEDPSQVEAGLLLSGILERGGHKTELAALLDRQLDSAKDRGDLATIVSVSMRLGALLEERDRLRDALDVYHAVLDWDAASNAALRAILRLSEARGDSFEIAEALEKLLAVETGEAAAQVAMRLFALRNEQGDPSLAERALEAGVKGHPASRELSELLIGRYQARGAYRELSALLQHAFDRAPENLDLLASLLDAYRQIGAFEAGAKAVTRALEQAPNHAPLYKERAALYEAMGHVDEALIDFERSFITGGTDYLQDFVQALERQAARAEPPADRAIKLRLSEVLCETGFPDAGRTHVVELLKREPKDKGALRALAKLEDTEQRWDAASATYRKLLPLEEGEALIDVALKLAEACQRANRLADARSGLERALKASPSHVAVRARLREVYEKTGAHGPLAQLILEDAAKETEVSGRFALLLMAANLLLGQEGNPDQAAQVLEEALTLRSEDDEGILLLGRAYAAQEKSSEALALFRSTLAQRKGRRSKQLSAMHREISRILRKNGDLAAALEALSKAFDMDLHNGEIALELGLLARDLENHDLASRAFRSVTFMKIAPAGTTDGSTSVAKGLSYFFLGQMAREKGDARKARLMVQKALIEDPNLERAKLLLDELKTV